MKIGVFSLSLDSFKHNDGSVNVTGDSIEQYFLSRRLNQIPGVSCESYGRNDQRGFENVPVNGLDVAIHLNLNRDLNVDYLCFAKQNIFYYQGAYPQFDHIFRLIDEKFDAVFFHSKEICKQYILSGGIKHAKYLPFATEHEFFTHYPYPRTKDGHDVCYIGSSITRSSEQYEKYFKPLLLSDLDFGLYGRYTPEESTPEISKFCCGQIGLDGQKKIYQTSKAGLCLINDFDKKHKVIPSRILDYMACGLIPLCEPYEEIQTTFGNLVQTINEKLGIIDSINLIKYMDQEKCNVISHWLRRKIIGCKWTYQSRAEEIVDFMRTKL